MFRVNDEKESRQIPLPLPGLASTQTDASIPPPGPRRAEQVLAWDLSLLSLKANDVITYHIEADDHAPREKPAPGVSPDREIRVVDEATVRKQLGDQLEATAQQVERLYTLERESQDRIRQLQKEIGASGGAATKKNP